MSSIYIVSEVLFAGMHHWSRGRQPRFKTELGRMSYFFSKDEAEKAIRANASHNSDERMSVYRYFLRELPYGEALYASEYKSEWVYDADGVLLDHSLCSTCHRDFHTMEFTFFGRKLEQIRFAVGDIVEWYDGDGNVWLGVVAGIPYSVERCKDLYETIRRSPRFAGLSDEQLFFPLDSSDDSYVVVNTENYMESHVHVSAHYVSAPTFPVPRKIRERFELCIKKYKNE